MGWWVADLLQDNPALLVSQIVWVIGSIVLHELAHGWAAIRQGDRTPIETGHMTWNPLVHMGGTSLIVFALVGIAWGAMPVNPSRFRGRYGDVLVSLAGPAMNIALAAVAVVIGVLWTTFAGGVGEPLWSNFAMFFYAGAFLNVFLAIFNLLPIPPLDGSRILAGFSPAYRRLIESPNAPFVGLALMVLIVSTMGGRLMDSAQWVVDRSSGLVRQGVGLVAPTSNPSLQEIDRAMEQVRANPALAEAFARVLRDQGLSADEIVGSLVESGWTEAEARELLKRVSEAPSPAPQGENETGEAGGP